MKKLFLFAVTCLGLFAACTGSVSDSKSESVSEPSSYTVGIDNVFASTFGLTEKIEVTIYECNESGSVVYENKCEFDADGSKDYVAHEGATSIKAFVEIIYIGYKKQTGWMPMAKALTPGEKVNMIMDAETNLYRERP